VRDYRLYLFEPVKGPDGRLTKPHRLREAHDAPAIRQADDRRQGRYAELWRDGELLRIFEPD